MQRTVTSGNSANSTNYNNDFLRHGMPLVLDDSYDVAELPDWRAAVFSIALPFPARGLPPSLTGERFIDLGPSWLPGRFRGIQTITTPIQVNGRFLAPDHGRDGDDSYEYTPRTFHQPASARFKGPLSQTVGSHQVDQGIPSKGAVSRSVGAAVSGDNATNQVDDVRCHRYMFDADTYKISPAGTNIREEGQPSHPTAKYRVRDGYTADHCSASAPSVSLVCAEFLQYRGMVTHRFHADTRTSETGELAHDFLVLHVVAENCDGPTLEKISQSLHRSRNVLDICDWDHHTRHKADKAPASCTSTKPGDQRVRLLSFFVNQAVHALNEGLPLPSGTTGQHRGFSAYVHKGGWLDGAYPNPGRTLRRCGPLPGASRFLCGGEWAAANLSAPSALFPVTGTTRNLNCSVMSARRTNRRGVNSTCGPGNSGPVPMSSPRASPGTPPTWRTRRTAAGTSTGPCSPRRTEQVSSGTPLRHVRTAARGCCRAPASSTSRSWSTGPPPCSRISGSGYVPSGSPPHRRPGTPLRVPHLTMRPTHSWRT